MYGKLIYRSRRLRRLPMPESLLLLHRLTHGCSEEAGFCWWARDPKTVSLMRNRKFPQLRRRVLPTVYRTFHTPECQFCWHCTTDYRQKQKLKNFECCDIWIFVWHMRNVMRCRKFLPSGSCRHNQKIHTDQRKRNIDVPNICQKWYLQCSNTTRVIIALVISSSCYTKRLTSDELLFSYFWKSVERGTNSS